MSKWLIIERLATNSVCSIRIGFTQAGGFREGSKKAEIWKKNSHISLQGDEKVQSRNVTTADTLMDLIRQMFPPNLIQVNPRHPDSVCVCVSDRQLNMVICSAVTAVWQNRQLFTYRHTRNKTLIHETSQVWIPKNTLDNMIKWIQDIARSLKLHPGLEIFFANLEENISA